jgi:hypothetical protein
MTIKSIHSQTDNELIRYVRRWGEKDQRAVIALAERFELLLEDFEALGKQMEHFYGLAKNKQTLD